MQTPAQPSRFAAPSSGDDSRHQTSTSTSCNLVPKKECGVGKNEQRGWSVWEPIPPQILPQVYERPSPIGWISRRRHGRQGSRDGRGADDGGGGALHAVEGGVAEGGRARLCGVGEQVGDASRHQARSEE